MEKETELVVLPKEVEQAKSALQIVFVVAPIVAGLDKFFHILVNWDQYMAPQIPQTIGIDAHSLMLAAGVVEIIAGIGVAIKPSVFGYVVGAWLLGIIGNLLLGGQYFDIALRDFGLAVSAFALARLSQARQRETLASYSTGT